MCVPWNLKVFTLSTCLTDVCCVYAALSFSSHKKIKSCRSYLHLGRDYFADTKPPVLPFCFLYAISDQPNDCGIICELYNAAVWWIDMNKIIGTLLLKEEKLTLITEITWNWQKKSSAKIDITLHKHIIIVKKFSFPPSLAEQDCCFLYKAPVLTLTGWGAATGENKRHRRDACQLVS